MTHKNKIKIKFAIQAPQQMKDSSSIHFLNCFLKEKNMHMECAIHINSAMGPEKYTLRISVTQKITNAIQNVRVFTFGLTQYTHHVPTFILKQLTPPIFAFALINLPVSSCWGKTRSSPWYLTQTPDHMCLIPNIFQTYQQNVNMPPLSAVLSNS